MYCYVFWVTELKSEVKITPLTIIFRHNLKKPHFSCDKKHGSIMDFKPLDWQMELD